MISASYSDPESIHESKNKGNPNPGYLLLCLIVKGYKCSLVVFYLSRAYSMW